MSTGLITHCVPESELGRGDRWGHWSYPHQHTTLPQTETQGIEAYLSLALHFREILNDTLFILLPKKAIKTETNVIKYWDADHKIVEFDSFMALADIIENESYLLNAKSNIWIELSGTDMFKVVLAPDAYCTGVAF